VKWSEVKWSKVKWSEVKWSKVKWSEVKWIEVKWRRNGGEKWRRRIRGKEKMIEGGMKR
jgi:hypothetical protein